MTAKERIAAIEKRQARLARQVKEAQAALYRLLLESVEKIEADPAYVETVFKQYQQSAGVRLVTALATDIAAISTYNYTYFLAYKDELNLSQKDFAKIKGTIDSFLKERIGLSGNKVVKNSFLDSILTDATIKQKVKQQAYSRLMTGDGATSFRKGMKALIEGEQGKLGAVESYYNTYVYDTYNQADSAIQEQYSKELGLEAFVYEGGVISTTRAFCRARDGRVWLVSETKDWVNDPDLPKNKPANYNPLIMRGLWNCRHGISFVTARRALRLRDDLELKNGKLVVKSS